MKKTLLTFSAAFFVFSLQAQESKAVSATDVLTAIVGKVAKISSKKSVQDILCKKADIWSGTITGRSGGGIACKSSKNFAALMKFSCTGYTGFDKSKCSDAIKKKFSSDADAGKVIQDVVVHNEDKLAGFVCTSAKYLPQLQAAVGNSCSAG